MAMLEMEVRRMSSERENLIKRYADTCLLMHLDTQDG